MVQAQSHVVSISLRKRPSVLLFVVYGGGDLEAVLQLRVHVLAQDHGPAQLTLTLLCRRQLSRGRVPRSFGESSRVDGRRKPVVQVGLLLGRGLERERESLLHASLLLPALQQRLASGRSLRAGVGAALASSISQLFRGTELDLKRLLDVQRVLGRGGSGSLCLAFFEAQTCFHFGHFGALHLELGIRLPNPLMKHGVAHLALSDSVVAIAHVTLTLRPHVLLKAEGVGRAVELVLRLVRLLARHGCETHLEVKSTLELPQCVAVRFCRGLGFRLEREDFIFHCGLGRTGNFLDRCS
mmetsp:Transcript_7615/g.14342  ORF Transcript_7615/g.14342 Transcript_7615/m.14342 type:complete len:297 (+) Transcript_7615:596-1486(+)